MTNEIITQPSVTSALSNASASHAPLGEVLLAARNAKKLTQHDVSTNLRISPKQVNALETNDFSVLPDAMITRGFIRNYARLLEIDAVPLLASYRERMPGKSPSEISVQPSMNQVMSGKDSQPWLMYILGSILILLFLLAWLFYVDYMPKPAKPVVEKAPETSAVNASSVEVALPEIALPAADREAVSGVTAIDENAVLAIPAINSAAPDATQPNQTVLVNTVQGTTPQGATPNKIQIAPIAQNSLSSAGAIDFSVLKANAAQATQPQLHQELQFPQELPSKVGTKVQSNSGITNAITKKVSVMADEPTWMRASDKSGAVVFEKMLAANSAYSFDGVPPFNILIGNAKATKLTLSGKQVDLNAYTKNNVARVTLE